MDARAWGNNFPLWALFKGMPRRWIVYGLFAIQGAMIWCCLWFSSEPWGGAVFGWMVGLAFALAGWPEWHSERGWRPWLELLAAGGAIYWLPATIEWVRWRTLPPSPHEGRLFIDPVVLFDLYTAVVLCIVLGLLVLLAVVRGISGWKLRVNDEVRPRFGTRDLMVLIALAGVHLAFGQGLLQRMMEWDWHRAHDWVLTGIVLRLLLFALPALLVYLVTLRLCLCEPRPWQFAVAAGTVALLGLLALAIVYNASWPLMLFWVTLVAQVAIHSLCLRALGYRLAR